MNACFAKRVIRGSGASPLSAKPEHPDTLIWVAGVKQKELGLRKPVLSQTLPIYPGHLPGNLSRKPTQDPGFGRWHA